MLRITDPSNFGRTLAGLSLIAAPLLLGVGEVLRLSIEQGAFTGEEEHLANVAGSAGLWQAMTMLNMVAVILFVPVVLGLVHLIRPGAPVLAHLGSALAMVGLLGAAGHNVFAFVLGGAMARLEDARPQMVELVGPLEESPSFLLVLLMFLVGFVLGFLLLAVGLYRSRAVHRWAAVAVAVAMLVGSNAGASFPLTLVFSGLLVLGLGTVAVRVLSMTDGQWRDLSPATGRTEVVEAGADAVPLS